MAFKTVTDIVSELFKLSKTQNLKVPGDKESKVFELWNANPTLLNLKGASPPEIYSSTLPSFDPLQDRRVTL